MGSNATSNYRRRRKENLIKVCGAKCNICGYDKVQGALEFHHIQPDKKEYGIAENGTCHDLEADLAEANKCILVCANCHREIHSGLYSEQELFNKKIYDEDFANQLRLDKKNKEAKTQYFCNECGVEITRYSKSGLCPSCWHKKGRLCDRPTREELKSLIRTLPFTKIGEMFNVSDNAIRKWCVQENLPSKKRDIQEYSDEVWESI